MSAHKFQEEPPSKKKRVESTNWTGKVFLSAASICLIVSTWVYHDDLFVLTDEVDEIEVYGSEAQSGTQLTTYSFEVEETRVFE